jgi:hypothetical protein
MAAKDLALKILIGIKDNTAPGSRSIRTGLKSISDQLGALQRGAVGFIGVWQGFNARRNLLDTAIAFQRVDAQLKNFSVRRKRRRAFADLEKRTQAMNRLSQAGRAGSLALAKIEGRIKETAAVARAAAEGTDRLALAIRRVSHYGAGLVVLSQFGRLAGIAKSVIDTADNLRDLANRVGTTVESMGALDYIAKLSGLEIEALSGLIVKLQRSMVEAGRDKKLALAFDQLGVSVAKLRELTPEEQILAIGQALERVDDPAQRNALALQILGRSGAELNQIFRDGSPAVRQAIEDYKELGGVSTEFADQADATNDAITRAQTAFSGLGRTIAASMAPALEGAANGLADFVRDFSRQSNELTGTGIQSQIDAYTLRVKELKSEFANAVGIRDTLGFVGRALFGAWTDVGSDGQFMKELAGTPQPGLSARFVPVR